MDEGVCVGGNIMFIKWHCAPCAWSGYNNTTPGLLLHHKCGNRTNAKQPMGHQRTQDAVWGRTGDLWKKQKTNTPPHRAYPTTCLWELADDIYPHINCLKILSGCISAHIKTPPSPWGNGGGDSASSSSPWCWNDGGDWTQAPNWICLICIRFEHPV